MASEHTGGMIALIPAEPGKLAVPGGDPKAEIHLTLASLGENITDWSPEVADAVKALAARMAADFAPVPARIMGHAVWNKDGGPTGDMKPCAVYQVQASPTLAEAHELAVRGAREAIGSALFPDQHEPFLPHITAGYEIDTSQMKVSGPIMLDTIRVELGNQATDYPLSGSHRAGDPTAVSYAEEGTETMAEETVDATKAGEPEVSTNNAGELELHWPCLVLEGMRTGDGRFIPYGSLGARGLPLPVAGQVTNDEGHKGAEVFGKITKLKRHEGPSVTSKETGEPFPQGTAVWEAWGVGDPQSRPGTLAAKGYLIGNSADIADATVEDELADGKPQRSLVGGKIGGTTLVPIPAFADGFVEVNGKRLDAQPAVEPIAASAAWTEMEPEHPASVVASASTEVPPLDWFTDPKLDRLTPLTRDGRHVFGHIADWNRPHTSFGGQQMFAPHSRSDYKWFNTGAFTASDGDGANRTVAVGRLTIGGGHANTGLSHREAVRLYDDAATAWAYVAAGEDQFGIWVNGVTADDVDDAVIRKAFAHPPSGDWRPIDGALELVAAHCVNSAGIPVPRARVASGEVVALVAAGYVAPAPDNPDVLAERVAELAADRVRAMLTAYFGEPFQPASLEDRHAAVMLGLRQTELIEELGEGLVIDDGWKAELGALDESDWALLDRIEGEPGELANWVTKAGGLPPYIERIKKHLEAKGMALSRAVATAVNVVKKMCATGDINFPGKQQVNTGSQAEACKDVARWESMKKAA